MSGKTISTQEVDNGEYTEANIEAIADREARKHGFWPVKGLFRGRRGWPDKLYFCPGARLLCVEYKKPDEVPKADQRAVHRKLRRLGFEVLVIDDPEEARQAIRRFANGETVDPEAG